MDLEEASSFHPDGLTFVRPTLEAAGAKVLNVFYDDDNILRDPCGSVTDSVHDLTKLMMHPTLSPSFRH
jgi:hypothetical protein